MASAVLVHGLMGTATAHYGACRARWSIPTVEVGLPGHGGDGAVPAHPVRAAVDRVAEAVLAREEPPVVVGLSYLGAAVALRAAEATGRAAGVVMSGYSFLVTRTTIERWLAGFTRMAARQGPTAEHFARLHGHGWEGLLAATVDELADGCLRLPDLDDLRGTDRPVLLVNGALLENERLAVGPAAECGADVAVVAGAGHVVPQDAPAVFVATVEEFVARAAAGRTVFHERRRAAAPVGGGAHG